MKTLVLVLVLTIAVAMAQQHMNAFGETYTLIPPSNIVEINGTNFTIPYNAEWGNITSIQINTIAKTLVVKIQSTSEGNLTITLPTKFINAFQSAALEPSYITLSRSYEQSTAHFVVTKNNHGIYYNEVDTADNRTLTIPYHMGNNTIEIEGTYMIPEFGSMTYVILLVSVFSIIAISKYHRVWQM